MHFFLHKSVLFSVLLSDADSGLCAAELWKTEQFCFLISSLCASAAPDLCVFLNLLSIKRNGALRYYNTDYTCDSGFFFFFYFEVKSS